MPSYIADRYAGILTREDVGQLFNLLTEKLHGNRSEAARQCRLTGKATYDWERAGYVKLTTKRKVLETCLRISFLSTVEYLLKRSSERTVDILQTMLSTMYAEAIETNSKERLAVLLDRFQILRTEYRGMINDRIMDEVEDMLWMLRQKAQELEIPVPPKAIEDISAKELLEVLPLIGDIYLKNPQGSPTIAKTLNLPPQSIQMLWPTFEKLHSIKRTFTEAEIGEIGIMWEMGPPLHDTASNLSVKVKITRGMESAQEKYAIIVGKQSAANPSDVRRAIPNHCIAK